MITSVNTDSTLLYIVGISTSVTTHIKSALSSSNADKLNI